MNAAPPAMYSGCSRPDSARTAPALKWAALHGAANAVAALAGVAPGCETEVLDFAAMMRGAAPSRRELAERGIEDVAAVIEPALLALLGAEARGINPGGAACTLWREFAAARAAILAMSPSACA